MVRRLLTKLHYTCTHKHKAQIESQTPKQDKHSEYNIKKKTSREMTQKSEKIHYTELTKNTKYDWTGPSILLKAEKKDKHRVVFILI